MKKIYEGERSEVALLHNCFTYFHLLERTVGRVNRCPIFNCVIAL